MRSRGFALILVVWILVLLSIMAAGFNSLVRVETRSAGWSAEKVQFQGAAMAAIHRAILGLSTKDSQRDWQVDGVPRKWQWQGFDVELKLLNEAAKVDLNYAPQVVLSRLFGLLLPEADVEALTGALRDWRDRDDQVSEHGAEDSAYRAAGLARLPANAPLTSIAELTQVLGFDAQTVEVLRPHVTVFARSTKLDASTASATVLKALPEADPDLVDAFVAQRTQSYANGEKPDFSLLGVGPQWIDTVRRPGVLSIEAVVTKDGHAHRERAVVRLQSSRGPYQVLAWDTLMEAGTHP